MAELPEERIANPPGQEALSENAVADVLAARYQRRMVGLARLLLRRDPLHTTIGAEDIANDALHEMFKSVASGRARRYAAGDDYWKLASLLVARQIAKHRYRLSRMRRGGSGSTKDSDGDGAFSQVEMDLELLQSRQVSPEELAAWKLDVEHWIEGLQDRGLRGIAQLMLEGYSQEEIATRTGQHRLTVCRKVQQLRIIWKTLDPGH